jgi:hypothetical protein
MSKPAPREDLQEIHGLLCASFLDYLRLVPPEKRTASMLNVMRGFLRDNRIQKDLTLHTDVQRSLQTLSAMDIPFFS